MLSIATNYVVGAIQNFFRKEDGADAIEYLLTIAVISIAVVAGVASGFPNAVLTTLVGTVVGHADACAQAAAGC